ncbi:Ubiquitin-conjugating enzyme [Drechslerella dactyloides]|uniref:Ubiquitin-conjugating enzyme n=1 Tax=Drechslerella dactyloides TaxID=74499 RepID=A0AAD6ISD9_DREDA|nr:Ubiquitin-conjugating enzyme [Drechslerella dactyloides]
MPRDQYDTDLYMASDDDFIEGVFVVGTGENEGEFLFQYHPLSGDSPSMISAIIVDMNRYPSGHEVFVFGCGEDAAEVGEKLADLPTLQGKPVKQILTTVSAHLRKKEADGSKKRPFVVNDDDDDSLRNIAMLDDEDDLSSPRRARRPSPMLIDDDGDDLYSLPTSPIVDKGKKPAVVPAAPAVKPLPPNRLVSDLRAAKDAGFKVGYYGSLKGSGVCYLVVSCRLSRLGLSDNALDAWHVETKRYINLIIEYPSGYANLDEIFNGRKGFRGLKSINVRMRVRQGDKYKPSKAECQAMFKRADTGKDMPYIFRSLELMLNERLVDLLRKRWENGYSWFGAEEMYHDKSQKGKSIDAMPATFWHDDSQLGGFSRLVTSDHFQDTDSPLARSFPLIAMQFFLRHFARYTDFCLVCHRRVTSDVEALEPYVCSTPECLHKYLSSDFGPGIERDLVEQPYVVDLLVSFCYAAARHQKLKDFPDALNLKVPYPAGAGPAGYSGTFDRANRELTLRINAANPISHPVQVGTWMTITGGGGAAGETLCCRAVDMSMFPIIKVSDPISTTAQASALNLGNTYTGGSAATAGSQQVMVDLFNKDFATLTPQAKQLCICLLLDTLPSVREMKDRLRQQHLSSWGDRISPAALGVLRWVVASNRACIVQVDGLESGSNGVFPATQAEDRVYGMGNWMQFRFAMGAPDKEQRFQAATSAAQRRLRLKHSTLFAWHGSPLVNWHSIIREGLNFNQTLNGRAYGNGCYHSLDFRTSSGYTGARHSIAGEQWSKSVLKVSSAVALNEIVNAPNEYVSRTPHLVVAQLDWIQTRYLFVQCAFSGQGAVRQKQPTQVKPQDPSMTPNGEQGKIIIPQPKAARARKDDLLAESSKGKKNEQYVTVVIDGIEERIPVEEDPGSDGTNDSDLDVFFEGPSDSLEVNDLDVAIALSMEETMADAPFIPAELPVRKKTNYGWLSAFGGVRGIRPLEPHQQQRQPPPLVVPPLVVPPLVVPTASPAGASSSSTAAAPATSATPATSAVPAPTAAAAVAAMARAAAAATPASPTSATTTSPLPAYDDIPLTSTTPPTYTPVVDLTGTASSSANVTPDPPRYFLRNNSTASSSSASTSINQSSPPLTSASSATSISSSRGSPGGFFDGLRKTFSIGGGGGSSASSSSSDPWNSAFNALPSTNPFSGAAKKGKAAARPVISAPIVIPPPLIPAAGPAPVMTVPKPAPLPVVASTSTAPAPVVAAPAKPTGPQTDFIAGELDYSTLPLIAQPTFATFTATKRLQREYKNLLKIQESTPLHELGWYTNPDHFDNVYQWIVELHTFDSSLPLAKDMKARGIRSVVLELRFGASFPTTPPFVRVIKPRFLPFMNGGGGHVTVGGAVCLEMLTGTGWDSKTTIESVLLNVRLAMMSTDPRPAKLEAAGGSGTYGVSEAVQAYLRACRTHGWAVPKGFEEMAGATR